MPPLTTPTIIGQLTSLGLSAGDTVMMHSSLSALGPVEGGPETVVDAILSAIGTEGTLMVPVFRDSVWGDPAEFTNTDCDCQSQDGLCTSQLPGFQGILTGMVRRRKGALRSCHKTHSWVALGPAARELLRPRRKSTSASYATSGRSCAMSCRVPERLSHARSAISTLTSRNC